MQHIDNIAAPLFQPLQKQCRLDEDHQLELWHRRHQEAMPDHPAPLTMPIFIAQCSNHWLNEVVKHSYRVGLCKLTIDPCISEQLRLLLL